MRLDHRNDFVSWCAEDVGSLDRTAIGRSNASVQLNLRSRLIALGPILR